MVPNQAAGSRPDAPAPRGSLALVLLLGLLVHLPTLGVGFFADDYVHQLVLAEDAPATPIPRWNLYDFGSTAGWAEFGSEHGALAWWTASDWTIRFFRPLTSLSLALDHALWGAHALGYHVTNLGLWLVLLVLAHRLFLALGLAPRTALVALLVFVLSDASSIPVGWIANRNSLLEALAAAGALLAARRGNALLALGLALAAALAKESGAFALLLVAAVLGSRGRLRPALGAVVLFGSYLAFLALAGYGTKSLFYATPGSDTGRFSWNVITMASAGVLALLGPLPLDVITLVPSAQLALIAVGVVAGWPLAAWILARVPRGQRWIPGLWVVLFLLPQGGAAPADRLLFVPALGAAVLLALAWQSERARWAQSSRLRRGGVLALALSITLGSGLYLVAQNANGLPGMANHVRAKALATDVGPRTLGRREVIVLQTESQMQAFTLGPTWLVESGDPEVRFWILQSGARALRWKRTGEREFELETLGRPFLDGPFERVYRTDEIPPPAGTRWTTPLYEVEALETGADGLRRVRVTFARALEDPALRFVRPIEGVLTQIEPPAIGAALELPEAVPTRPFVP